MVLTEEDIILKNQPQSFKKLDLLRSVRENRLNTEHFDKQHYKQLFQNVVHDLKNPIGNILGVVYLLEADLQREEDKELLQIIQNSCYNALSILDSLLADEKKQEKLSLEKISVNSLIEGCLADVTGSLALKNLHVQHQALGDDLFILADKQ